MKEFNLYSCIFQYKNSLLNCLDYAEVVYGIFIRAGDNIFDVSISRKKKQRSIWFLFYDEFASLVPF